MSKKYSHPLKSCAAISALILTFLITTSPQTSHAQRREGSRQLEQVGPIESLPSNNKRWALIIGVDQYRDPQISGLKGAANDAQTLADALVRYAGFPSDQVILLTTDQPEERQPTRLNIYRRLSNLASLIPKDGLLLVSFSGHGMERNGQAYLLPTDAQISDDVMFLEQAAVSTSWMKERIRMTGVGQVLILLDACRNDPVGRADSPNLLTEAYTRNFNFDVRNREVTAFATLYATSKGQRAYEYSEKKQGYFTWAVVEGLKGKAANERGEVTLANLIKYVQETVPKQVGIDLGAGKQQRPFAVIEGYRADELVIAVVERKPPVVADEINSTPQAPHIDSATVELSFWETIKNSADPEDFKAYIKVFPNGRFVEQAKKRIQTEAALRPPSSTTKSSAAQDITNKSSRLLDETPSSSRLGSGNSVSSGTISDVTYAYSLLEQKQYIEAARSAKQIVSANPNIAEAWKIAGFAELNLKQYPEASVDLQKALNLQRAANQEDPFTSDALAHAYFLSDKFDRALPLLIAATARRSPKPDPITIYYRGVAEYKTGNAVNAERTFNLIVKENPKNADSLFYLGMIAYDRKDFDAVISVLNRATTADARSVPAWNLLTLAYLQRAAAAKSPAQADADYLSAVRAGEGLTRVRTDVAANILFAQALIAAKQFARAATVLERFTTGADASPSALYLYGVSQSRAQNFPKAISALERAATKTPDDANIYRELGYAYEVSKQYAKALAAYEKGMKLAPNDADFRESAERVRPFAK